MKKDLLSQVELMDMQDRCVKINEGSTSYGGRYKGRTGVIVRPGADSIGVKLDNEEPNPASSYGVYWFKKRELCLVIMKTDSTKFDDAMVRLGDTISSAMYHATETSFFASALQTDMAKLRDKQAYGVLTNEQYNAYVNGVWDGTVTAKKEEDYMTIVELAKQRDIKMICDKNTQTINDLLDADEVIQAMNKKRELADQKPLCHAQKLGICTAETDELMKKAQEEADKEKHDLDVKYTELYAALELPEVNVIEVLKAAGVLNEAGTGLA